METVLMTVSEKRKPADLLIAGFFENDKWSKELVQLEPDFSKAAQAALERKRFSGKSAQVFSSYSGQYREAAEIMILGLGEKKKYGVTGFRQAAGNIIKAAKRTKAKTVRVLLDTFLAGGVHLEQAAGIISEVSILASYEFKRYKTKTDEEDKIETVAKIEVLVSKKPGGNAIQRRMEWNRIVAQGVILARDFINEPANVMNADRLSEEAKKLAVEKKIHCEILHLAQLKQLKMGGILSVNQGSRTPPALVILEYGKNYQKKGTVCLVGKGVTFDTGGISLKPSKDMDKMKYDMAGAAAVIATLGVAADLKLPVHVIGLAPLVENMVAEDPQRPGDIIRMYNGKTVEVLNTDAEGRLILGDALSYTEKYHPKAILDIATLTGSCAATFGDKAIGLLGTDARLLARVKKAGEETGERCWELPLWDEYAESIKGLHADINNIGGPYAGTITATMFLKEFVPANTPWAHLDIAGTAWSEGNRPDCPKGAAGAGVRLFARFLTNWAGK